MKISTTVNRAALIKNNLSKLTEMDKQKYFSIQRTLKGAIQEWIDEGREIADARDELMDSYEDQYADLLGRLAKKESDLLDEKDPKTEKEIESLKKKVNLLKPQYKKEVLPLEQRERTFNEKMRKTTVSITFNREDLAVLKKSLEENAVSVATTGEKVNNAILDEIDTFLNEIQNGQKGSK